ncbi:MAG TPA: methyl-accepting chemotaxis protein [Thermoanaerobaculia bacterium]|nr:methyl-accepting chemotaxis protein [Thermoanaerobaculia bacterium]
MSTDSGARSFFHSLRGKLIAVFLLIGLLPMAIVAGLSYYNAAKALRANAGASLQELAFNASDKLDRNLFERYGDVQAFAKSDPAKSMDPKRLNVWMNVMMMTYTPIYNLMVVADMNGRIIAVSSIDNSGQPIQSASLIGMDVSTQEWFRQGSSGTLGEGVSFVEGLHEDLLVARVFGTGARSYAMNFTYPIYDDQKKIIGVWSNRFNWHVAEDILGAVIQHARTSGSTTTRLTLVSREGKVLASDKAAEILTRELSGQSIVQQARAKGTAGYGEGPSFDQSNATEMFGFFHSAGYSVYPGLDWSLISSQERDEALAEARTLASTSGILAVGALVAIIFLAFFVARVFTRPLNTITETLHNLATSEANLSERLPVASNDEVGRLSENFNMFMDNLETLIQQVLRSGIQVTTSTTQIAAGSKELEATVAEQVAATNEVVATAREITATSHDLAQTMNDVSGLADQTASSAGLGQRDLSQMEDSMGRMEDASKAVSAKLAVINEKAGNISSVVTTITKVADQTNLLSLNAAIEAEKAGQYGQGFAVVAREIRRLADQTAVATLDIEKMVKEMKTAVSSGVMSMDKFSDQVRQAVEAVKQVGLQLAKIIDQVQEVSPRYEAVHVGMQAQSQGAQQISQSMSQLSETTQQTASALRETNRAIEGLNEAANGLQRMFSRFKLSGEVV